MVSFRCYNGRDSWRAAIPAEFDDEVDTALEVLQQRRSLHDERYFKELRGRCEDLTEVRVDFELELDDPRFEKSWVGEADRAAPGDHKFTSAFSDLKRRMISFCCTASKSGADRTMGQHAVLPTTDDKE
jgi:hypothetical protein